MNPGVSDACTTDFPHASAMSTARCTAVSEESSPRTTSTRGMTGAGLKKCMPTILSGHSLAAPNSVFESEEVFVAITDVDGDTLSLSLQSAPDYVSYTATDSASGLISINSVDGSVTGNIVFEQEFENSSDSGLEIAYAGQLLYRLTANIQPGVEVFGRLGELNDIAIGNEQHQIGPGVFGFFELNDNYGFKYELGWLIGYTDVTPENTAKFLIEFEYKY